jgi:organic radical activating enzyme
MFGKNRILSKNHGDGQTLRIVRGSPWLTLQGEGPYAGRAAVFIRLHGCNLRCTFCDTNFDQDDNPFVDIDELAQQVTDIRGAARLVVITGGEPLRQNILPLCRLLRYRLMMVQIETAGTLWIDGIEGAADIVTSPKTPTININAYEGSLAFKYVISSKYVADDTYLPMMATQPGAKPALLAGPRPGAQVFLSPMDEYDEKQNQLNRETVAQLAIKYNVIAGLQLHKHMGVD